MHCKRAQFDYLFFSGVLSALLVAFILMIIFLIIKTLDSNSLVHSFESCKWFLEAFFFFVSQSRKLKTVLVAYVCEVQLFPKLG